MHRSRSITTYVVQKAISKLIHFGTTHGWCVKTRIKAKRKKTHLHHIKFEHQLLFGTINLKVDHKTGGKWVIHGPKYLNENQLPSLKRSCWLNILFWNFYTPFQIYTALKFTQLQKQDCIVKRSGYKIEEYIANEWWLVSQFKDVNKTQNKISKMQNFRCTGSKCCVKFQRCPLKFHTKRSAYSPPNVHFNRCLTDYDILKL